MALVEQDENLAYGLEEGNYKIDVDTRKRLRVLLNPEVSYFATAVLRRICFNLPTVALVALETPINTSPFSASYLESRLNYVLFDNETLDITQYPTEETLDRQIHDQFRVIINWYGETPEDQMFYARDLKIEEDTGEEVPIPGLIKPLLPIARLQRGHQIWGDLFQVRGSYAGKGTNFFRPVTTFARLENVLEINSTGALYARTILERGLAILRDPAQARVWAELTRLGTEEDSDI